MKNFLKRFYLIIILLFLYLPIVTLIVLSFNDTKTMGVWKGFTLKWYQEMFSNPQVLNAFCNTLFIALIAAVLKPLMEYEIVAHIFAGIRLAVCALITASVYKLFKKTVTNVTTFALFLLAFLFVTVGGVSPVFVVLGAAIVGLAWGGLKKC